MKWLFRFKNTAFSEPEGLGLCVSFPKSGRTWLRVMLDELLISLRYTHAGSAHKLAHPLEQLPNPARWLGDKPVIFLHRDPRDVVVSGFFQVTKRRRSYDGDMSAFLRDPRYGIRKVLAFNDLWLAAARDRLDVCVVSYEALHGSVHDELHRIANFFGQARDAASFAEAAEAGRFETMQEKEMSGAYRNRYGSVLRPKNPRDPETFKVRRGAIGGFVDYFSAEDIAYCEDVMARRPRGS